jgi:phosphoenolpyruvate carboxylase
VLLVQFIKSPVLGVAIMIRETIEKIEKRIESTDSVKSKDKQELLKLLSALETEIVSLSKTHPEHAESITGFTNVSTHEATRGQKNPQLVKLSIKGLTSSVEGFENSHEELVKIVNSLAIMLSSVGI